MSKQRYYTNGEVYIPNQHSEARNILGSKYYEYGNFSPALVDSHSVQHNAIKIYTKGKFTFEEYEMNSNGRQEKWVRYFKIN